MTNEREGIINSRQLYQGYFVRYSDEQISTRFQQRFGYPPPKIIRNEWIVLIPIKTKESIDEQD